MQNLVEHHEAGLRLGLFVGVFAIMAMLEVVSPRKARTQTRAKRWATNLGNLVIYSVLMRFVFPVAAMGAASFAISKEWGLLNMFPLPVSANIILTFLVLDFAIYWQHVVSHKIPVLWRIHKMHHADRDIDVSTGARFHPLEIILSMLYKMLVIVLLGSAVIGVFVFEILLTASSMFNHANVKLPLWLDRAVRVFVVTPDMHRVHHSTVGTETDRNYGFFLSLWDKIFQTYQEQPKAGHNDMVIGLPQYQSEKPAHLLWSLMLPFRKSP